MKESGDIFTRRVLDELFPAEKTDQFFEALFGDAEEGSYDIRLAYNGQQSNRLLFVFELHQRPGCCLNCSLTYGLPTVFSRHPLLDVPRLVRKIAEKFYGQPRELGWELGQTSQDTSALHSIPLYITLAAN